MFFTFFKLYKWYQIAQRIGKGKKGIYEKGIKIKYETPDAAPMIRISDDEKSFVIVNFYIFNIYFLDHIHQRDSTSPLQSTYFKCNPQEFELTIKNTIFLTMCVT